MSMDLPKKTRVVIVGNGVIGASVAWHLTAMGCCNIVVLERGKAGCGTTWHSAGNIIRMTADPVSAQILGETADIIAQLHQRHDIGWNQCGRVMLAQTRQRLREFRAITRTLQRLGVEVETISPSQVRYKLPVMDTGDILGALWSPGDGRVDSTSLTSAYNREARDRGAVFVEGISVKQALTRDDQVVGVETSHGQIECEVMINCTGMWARELGLRNHVNIPLYPVQHFYMLTEAMPGIYPDMPTFRDPDSLIYGREEVGGLLVGCFDRNALPVRLSDLPEPFEFALLNENWDQFQPYMQQSIRRIPGLAHSGIRHLVNGPESFTPDGEPHLDQAPDLKNYFVLAGLNSSGITRSGGMGGALARWILTGDPGLDVSKFSLRRFTAGQNQENYLRRCVQDLPSSHFAMKKPVDQTDQPDPDHPNQGLHF